MAHTQPVDMVKPLIELEAHRLRELATEMRQNRGRRERRLVESWANTIDHVAETLVLSIAPGSESRWRDTAVGLSKATLWLVAGAFLGVGAERMVDDVWAGAEEDQVIHACVRAALEVDSAIDAIVHVNGVVGYADVHLEPFTSEASGSSVGPTEPIRAETVTARVEVGSPTTAQPIQSGTVTAKAEVMSPKPPSSPPPGTVTARAFVSEPVPAGGVDSTGVPTVIQVPPAEITVTGVPVTLSTGEPQQDAG